MDHFEGYAEPGFREVESLFRGLLPRGKPGGAALTVMHHGRVVVDLAGGTRDAAGNPFTRDTLALSFSTTKGVASTVLHVLRDRGLLDYDAPVARYWPAFAAGGKGSITVRQVLCHEAGLHSVRALVTDAKELLDWEGMLRRVEAARPTRTPGEGSAYHALTYGFLVGGLVEQITGQRFAEVLDETLVRPLGLTGCYVGLPERELPRAARLVTEARLPGSRGQRGASGPRPKGLRARATGLAVRAVTQAIGLDPTVFREALLAPNASAFDWTADETLKACIPAASGTFDARSLARIYAMLANGGELDGVRVLSRETVHELGRVQSRGRDAVLPMPMRWRLGYHHAISLGGRTRRGFGHFGFGGSGAFAEPDRGLGVGFVLNHGVGTPFGDARIWRINAALLRAADARGRR